MVATVPINIGFIDCLHVNFDIMVIFLYVFGCGANRLWFRFLLSNQFEQFGSLHMCAPIKYMGCSANLTRYPWALSQPRYQ